MHAMRGKGIVKPRSASTINRMKVKHCKVSIPLDGKYNDEKTYGLCWRTRESERQAKVSVEGKEARTGFGRISIRRCGLADYGCLARLVTGRPGPGIGREHRLFWKSLAAQLPYGLRRGEYDSLRSMPIADEEQYHYTIEFVIVIANDSKMV